MKDIELTYYYGGYPFTYVVEDGKKALSDLMANDMNKFYEEQAKKRDKVYKPMSKEQVYQVLDYFDYFEDEVTVDALVDIHEEELLDMYEDDALEWYLTDYNDVD